MHSQAKEEMTLSIIIEFREFGNFVFRETLAPTFQESVLSTEEPNTPQIVLPAASTQGGEQILFGPALLTFA